MIKVNFKSTLKVPMLVITFAITFGSCASFLQNNTTVYDTTVPIEQLATLVVPANYTVTNFNGKTVKWTCKGIAGLAIIRIPAGEHTIKYQFKENKNVGQTTTNTNQFGQPARKTTTTYRYTEFDREVTANLEAGKKYQIYENGIGIYSNVANISADKLP